MNYCLLKLPHNIEAAMNCIYMRIPWTCLCCHLKSLLTCSSSVCRTGTRTLHQNSKDGICHQTWTLLLRTKTGTQWACRLEVSLFSPFITCSLIPLLPTCLGRFAKFKTQKFGSFIWIIELQADIGRAFFEGVDRSLPSAFFMILRVTTRTQPCKRLRIWSRRRG